VIREVEAGTSRRKSLADIKSLKTRFPSGGTSIGSIRIVLLLDVVTPTLTKHAFTNSSAWWGVSPWRMTFKKALAETGNRELKQTVDAGNCSMELLRQHLDERPTT